MQKWFVLATKVVCGVASWLLLLPYEFVRAFGLGGRDPHWQLALHHAWEEGLTHGSDFIFTFGPLGFLFARLPVEGFQQWYLAVDILLMLAFAYVLWVVLTRIQDVFAVLVVPLICFVLSTYHNPPQLPFMLLALFVFFIGDGLVGKRFLSLVVAFAISIVSFYLKLGSGLPLVVISLLLLCNTLLRGRFVGSRCAALG